VSQPTVAFNTSTGGPFTETNNGYFSTWFALLSAMAFSYHSATDAYREQINVEVCRQNTALVILFVASVVELAVASDVCAAADVCNGHEKFAVFVGLSSCVVVTGNNLLRWLQHPGAEGFSKVLAPLVSWPRHKTIFGSPPFVPRVTRTTFACKAPFQHSRRALTSV
jgi:hypothetical protein